MFVLGGTAIGTSPTCHVFTVGTDFYAYDLNSQQLLAVEPELAALLRQDGSSSRGALDALRKAQDEGLFRSHQLRMVPPQIPNGSRVDQGLQHLVLTVTEACNLRCTYCLHGADLPWVRPHGRVRMSVEMAIAAVEYYLERRDPARDPMISFYGGEPLLNSTVIEAVVARVRHGPRGEDSIVSIDTNGVLLDETAITLVLRHRLHLQISLDGPALIHDRHRRDGQDRPTFDRVMANIGRLLNQDISTADRLTFVITLAPPVDLFAVADFFAIFPPYAERGITKQPNVTVNFANLNGQNWEQGQEEANGLPSVTDQVAQARELYLEAFADCKRHEISPVIRALFEPDLIRLHHRSRAPLGETYTPGGNCRPGRRQLHVTVDGRLQPCERTGEPMTLGTVRTGIQADAVRRLNEEFHGAVKNRCARCWALRLCGVCFATQAENADRESGSFPVPERVCQRVRAQKEETLRMMVRILAMPPETREWFDRTKLD